MSLTFMLSQILVLVALAIIVFSALSKRKQNILYYRIPFAIVYSISFALQGLWIPFSTMLFSGFRSTVFYSFEKKGKKPNIYVLIGFMLILIITSSILWTGMIDLLPIGTALIVVWAFWQTSAKRLRIAVLLATSSMIIYNILVLNYMGIVIEAFIQTLQIIAFVRYDIFKKESLIKADK